MNKVIYLAGAMPCYFNAQQHEYPKKWREDVKKYVKELYNGITIISPADYCEIDKDYCKTESESMRFHLRMVREADIILVNLKDLHTSLHTSDEIFYGFISGKPIIGFLGDETKYKEIHSWKIEQIDRIETGRHAMKRAIDYIYKYYVEEYN